MAGRLRYTLAYLGMFAALYVLCGAYLSYNLPELLRDAQRFTTLLGLTVLTVAVSVFASPATWLPDSWM